MHPQSFFGRLAHLVDRVARDYDHDSRGGIVEHRVASEPRGRREPRRLVEQVFLLLARFAELVEALLYDHVTGCARAVATARVLGMNPMSAHHTADRIG